MQNINYFDTGFSINNQNLFSISKKNEDEFNEIISNDSLNFHGKKSIKVINKNLIQNFKYLSEVYSRVSKYLLNYHSNLDIKFEDVWVQESKFITYEKDKLPFVPHIDKIRKFKVMVYINDISSDAGPVSFFKIDPNFMEDKRLNSKNEIENIDKREFTECIGKLGTVILFDTNCPHFAGSFSNKDSIRKIYRFNYAYNFLEKKNIFSKIIPNFLK